MNPYVLIAAGLMVIGAAIGGFFEGEHVQADADQVVADRLKIDAANVLQEQTMKVMLAERIATAALAQMEKDTHDHEQALSDANSRADAAVLRSGGLHDPGGRGGSCPAAVARPAPQAGGHANPPAGTRLSDEATGFLRSESRRADEVVLRLQACEADDASIRATVSGQ